MTMTIVKMMMLSLKLCNARLLTPSAINFDTDEIKYIFHPFTDYSEDSSAANSDTDEMTSLVYALISIRTAELSILRDEIK